MTASWCSPRFRTRWGQTPSAAYSTRSGRTRTSTAFIRSTSDCSCRTEPSSSPAPLPASSSCSSDPEIAIGGQAGRCHRSQRHRRQTDGAAAASSPRHDHGVSLADAGTAGLSLPSRYRGGGDRPSRVRHREFIKPGAAVIDVGITSITDRAVVESLFPAGSKRREAFERRGSITRRGRSSGG